MASVRSPFRPHVFIITLCVLLGQSLEQSQQNGSQCGSFICREGKMCVTKTDGQKECQCPTSCQLFREDRVCSVYGIEFRNLCELHRFACAHRLDIAVKKRGRCQNQGKRKCQRWKIPRFSNRFMEISYMRMNISLGAKLIKHIRAEKMSPKAKYDSCMFVLKKHDANKNGKLDWKEWGSVIAELRPFKACISGFLQSCDVDGSRDITSSEWLEGFRLKVPTTTRVTTRRPPTTARKETTPPPTTAQKTTKEQTTTLLRTTTQMPTTTKATTTSPRPCTKICPAGKPNALCTACDCVDHILRGRVVTIRGEPLAGANVSLARNPTRLIGQTDISGYVFITGLCVDQETFRIVRQGYFPLELSASIESRYSSHFEAKLRDAVPPVVVVHPEDQVGFPGRGVTFCCKGKGDPAPNIEWYRNGKLLNAATYNYGETLYIPDASTMEGRYKCRVVNPLGSEFSEIAELKMFDLRTKKCQSQPKQAFVSLPKGCVDSVTGLERVDMGQCDLSGSCMSRSVHEQQSCKQNEYCCGIKTVEQVKVKCKGTYDEGNVNLTRVTSCGCTKCEERDTVIKGVVVGGINEEPIANSSIMVNDERWAVTDNKGRFKLLIPKHTKRLVVTVVDVKGNYAQTTKHLAFLRGRTVFQKIILLHPDPPVEFDSGKKLQVPLGHANGEAPVTEIEVPEKSLMTQDGRNFTGRARATVTYMDSRNRTDIESAPGDFTTVDSNGLEQRLKSYGMFKVGFVDESNKPLDLVKNMTVKFDPEEVGLSSGSVPPNLWWLDEATGRWVDAGKLQSVTDKSRRSKRSNGPKTFFIGNVTTDKLRWLNIDVPERTCYLKVKVYRKGEGQDHHPISFAKVSWIGQENNNFYGYESGVTDSNGVVCLKSWCNNYGYLQANVFRRTLTPDASQMRKLPDVVKAEVIPGEKSKSIKMLSTAAFNGPVFEDDDHAKCREKSALFFGFDTGKDKQLTAILKPHQTSWIRPSNSDRRCFLKIVVNMFNYYIWRTMDRITLMVESFSANGTERYGFVTHQGEPWKSTRIACVEYFCSENSPTLVRVSVFGSKDFAYSYLVTDLQKAQPNKAEFWNCKAKNQRDFMIFPELQERLGQRAGLYSGFNNEGEMACRLGTDITVGERNVTSTDYALFLDNSINWQTCDYCDDQTSVPETAKQFCSDGDAVELN